MRFLITCLGCLAVLLPVTSLAAETGIGVREPWIREAPPGAQVLAAYMIIDNPGTVPATITRITSPDFRRTELHRTQVENGVAGMVPLSELEIPAGGSVALLPGGIHLMLFDPLHPLRAGDSATLVIHDREGDRVTVQAFVARHTGDSSHHEHHH